MNRIWAELSESLATSTNDADAGSGDRLFLVGLFSPSGSSPRNTSAGVRVAQSRCELLSDEVAVLAVRTVNSEVL